MINTLTLYFPDGISMKDAQAISVEAEEITMTGCSQGGYKCLTPDTLVYMDGPVEWSEDHVEFMHTYNRNNAR